MPIKFQRFEKDGREHIAAPLSVYDSALIVPGATSTNFTYTAHPETNPGYVFAQIPEDRLLDVALQFDDVFRFLHIQVGRDPAASWCLIGEQRTSLLPGDKERVPGDFDLIIGPVRDGYVAFDELSEIEVKRCPVESSGKKASTPSGTGTKQARGAAEVGFDRVLLVQLLPNQDKPLPPGFAPSWESILSGDCFEAIERTSRTTEERLGPNPPCGYALIGWGAPAATNPLLTGSHTPVSALPAPFRPLAHRAEMSDKRKRLEEALRRRFGGDRRPAARFFRPCEKCTRIFAPMGSKTRSCGC